MGDDGPISPTDKQFLEDLEKAKRLSLEEFEREKKRFSGKPTSSFLLKRTSSPALTNNPRDDSSRNNLNITPRPRPFSSRAVTNNSGGSAILSTSVAGKIIQTPQQEQQQKDQSPVSIDPPPDGCLRRNRSLPYRYRNSSINHGSRDEVGDTLESCSSSGHPSDSVASTTATTNTTTNTVLDTFSPPNDDLIVFASPKVTPKFPLLGLKNPNFCDIPSSTSSSSSIISSPPPPTTLNASNSFTSSLSPLPYGANCIGAFSPTQHSIGFGPIMNMTNFSPTPLLNHHNNPSFNPMERHLHNLQMSRQVSNVTFPSSSSTFPTAMILNAATNNGSAFGLTSSKNNNLSPNRQNSNSSSSGSSNRSMYSALSEQIKSMTFRDDLIDLGQSDGSNILEYFDPLVINEKLKNATNINTSITATTTKDNTNSSEDTEKQPSQGQGMETTTTSSTQKSTSPATTTTTAKSEIYESSASSVASTATSSFSFRLGPPSLSLYPSLQEFQSDTSTVYGTLPDSTNDNHNDRDNGSSLYDVYNPLEYLYTVSCSSPSTSSTYEAVFSPHSETLGTIPRPIGFSHFFENQYPATTATAEPPALPPRNAEVVAESAESSPVVVPKPSLRLITRSKEKSKRYGRLYENIESVKQKASTDSEIQAFFDMIRELRFSNRHVDSTTNVGFIRSSTLENKCPQSALSLKVIVWEETVSSEPAAFTCDVSTTVDMIVDQSLIDLEHTGSGRDYMLRIKGLNEYMSSEVPLANYRYVQECIKLDQDIQLVLVSKAFMEKSSWARTPRDDAASVSITIDEILPQTHSKTITYKDISIPLEVIDRESERLKEKLAGCGGRHSVKDVSSFLLNSASLMQPVKAVCVLLGEVQTVEIVEILDIFSKACSDWNSKLKTVSPTTDSGEASKRRTKIVSDCNSRHSIVEIMPRSTSVNNSIFDEKLKDNVFSALERLEDSVRQLVEMYSKSFPVSFRMKEPPETVRSGWSNNNNYKPMSDMIESFLLRIGAVHRPSTKWLTTYTEYYLSAEVYHGARWMGKVNTGVVKVTKSDNNIFFNTLVVNSWINFEHLPVCILPRESRVVFSLFGRKPNEDNNSVNSEELMKKPWEELGWASMQCFNFKGMLAQGNYLLPFWPVGLVQKRLGPAPDSSFSSDRNSPLLTIAFTDFGAELPFPEVPTSLCSPRDFKSLDPGTQVLLQDIFEHSPFTKFPAEAREVLWEKRHYLHDFPGALPKVLMSAQLWDWASLAELHAMLHCWKPLEPIEALQLLLPCFPDAKVREQGIEWVSNMSDEDLINLLPQLVEALSFETFDYSPLARFLLKKALSCLKISHYLFWLFVQELGLGKWAAEFSSDAIISKVPLPTAENIYDPKRRRLELMFNSLMVMSGSKWRQGLVAQYRLMEGFYDVANQVKAATGSSRQAVLMQEMNKVQMHILSSTESIPLPLSPSYDVKAIDVKACSFFNSASVPLKIGLINGLAEKGVINTLYKVGDDLRQDMLTIQIIRVMEKWWLQAGLDLRVLTFSCVPTGIKQGFVEMVPNAETLCRIQAEHGLTGAFRNRPLCEWIAKMNPSTLDYRRAIENFTLSCAAYCVVTYVLGICDRHNDNIMLTKKGHLFHIDFGKFLGDAQMFGSIIKRDRSPFVLTSDMVYVINDGEKDSSKFHRFVELCCQAFRVVRQNGNTLLNLFALMATAGIPGVSTNSVLYIQNALLPECSNSEAAARFASFIQESLQNWFTPVNFFLHTLAQMPFGPDSADDPTTLSFVPTVYTMEMDGRISQAELVSFSKKYDPEKKYVYTVLLRRKGQTEWSYIHRSYKEFLEFHTKLCLNFPKAVGALKSLPRGSGLTRSNIKQVTEKRKVLLEMFLDSLFTLADEICHSNLVYTFFHPLLRDEEQHQEDEIERKASSRVSLSRSPSRIHGQIKLSLEYQKGALHVLILHAVDLACPNLTPPSPYVKTYLQPDPYRKTKRKTKVVKKSQHPTFMEMIEYRLPLELIQVRVLAVSVWHHDPFQENNFLGGVTIPMKHLTMNRGEITETFPLGNIVSTPVN